MDGLSYYTKDERPWGGFERFTFGEPSTVKLITVKAGEAFSLQMHAHRDEYWRIISGGGIVTKGQEKHNAMAGGNFFIPRGIAHRVEAGSSDLTLLEISFGEFDENDITRLEDRYGRA
jgi:mannose-6-phosphate isomerase-like protein (cupin superfamily)